MTTLFLTAAFLGGAALVLQLAATLLGLEHGHDSADGLHSLEEGANLFSVRAVTAGIAFFGIGGLIGMSTPLRIVLALPLGLVLGGAAMYGTAWAMRQMLRFEDDGTMSVENAIGVSGTVYLSIPAGRAGTGKVHVAVQNRLVELQAVTSHTEVLPTGSRVMVVDVVSPDVVDVVPDPLPQLEVSNAGA